MQSENTNFRWWGNRFLWGSTWRGVGVGYMLLGARYYTLIFFFSSGQHKLLELNHQFYPISDQKLAEIGPRQRQVADGPLHQGADQTGQGGDLEGAQTDRDAIDGAGIVMLFCFDLCRPVYVKYIWQNIS